MSAATSSMPKSPAAFLNGPAPSALTPDPLRTSVLHLMAQAFSLTCSTAAQAFAQLVQPTARFQVALDSILPLLTGHADIPRRILASYILYSLYSDHPMMLNPFRSVFLDIFLHEQEVVTHEEADLRGASESEQLIWVLWKILRGEGADLSPYTPETLAGEPLPPKLRARNLRVDDSLAGDDDTASPRSSGSSGRSRGSPALQSPMSPIDGSNSNQRSMSSNSKLADAREQFITQGKHFLQAACSRVLNLTEQRMVAMSLPHFVVKDFVELHDLPTLITLNSNLGHPIVVSLLKMVPDSIVNYHSRLAYLNVLRQLPPTLPSFNILGRLLRDGTLIPDATLEGKTTVADLVRVEVLGAFVLNCIKWVEQSQSDALEGLVSDDRATKAVQNLCRFYNSLIKLGIVDPSSDADSVEMAHFALTHAFLEEANALYRVLALGKF